MNAVVTNSSCLSFVCHSSNCSATTTAPIVYGEELTKFRDMVMENIEQINYQDAKGWTALHYAVYLKNVDVMAILMACGIDDSIKNNEGSKAMDLKWW